MPTKVRAGIFLALCLLLPSRAGLAQERPDVPYVPTPWNVVEAMLDIGRVNADDYVIDLGSGDGRIVIEAARKHGARGMGIELDANLVSIANREAGRLGVGARANFVSGNLFNFDFGQATLLTMYLLPALNLQLRPRILSGLRPGTRIVSHDFDMGRWKPDAAREIAVPNKSYGAPVSQIYLWYVPADASGKWRWQLPVGGAMREYEATFRQTFQELNAEAAVDGGAVTSRGAQLRGDSISLTLTHAIDGRDYTQELTGRIRGDSIVGSVRLVGGAQTTLDWQATRIARGKITTE
jgi:SAM-dependent methyltransferase